MSTINTNNLNPALVLTADDFIPFESFPVKTIPPKKYLKINEVNICGKTYPSVNLDYWRCCVTLDILKHFSPKFAEKMIALFGEEIVERNLNNITMHNLTSTDEIAVEYLDNMMKLTNGFLIGGLQTITVTKYRGGWERKEEVKGVKVVIPSHYSSNYEGPIMSGCLEDKYPWLKYFKCSFYGYNTNDDYEFYVDVTPPEEKDEEKKQFTQTLYVNLKAITEQNPQIIKDRMESYFKWFYRNNEENYKRAMGALETPLGKLFLECVSGNTSNIPQTTLQTEKMYENQMQGQKYEYLVVLTKNNHSSVKNFDSLKKAIEHFKWKINILLEDYGQSDITFTPCWYKGEAVFIKKNVYELQLLRIITKDINE